MILPLFILIVGLVVDLRTDPQRRQKVNDEPPRNRNIAMVFQDYALYPHMTVYQNMAFSLKLSKFPKDEIDRRVREAAEILGIQGLLKRKPKELSGGQRQRVAVGRAIVRKPDVFLFDEPLSNLDAKLRGQMRAELSRLHQRLATTMIYVTHDQVEAMTMGTQIVIMCDGVIQQVGAPMEIYEYPINRFVAGFIGSPGMNFLPAEIKAEEGDLTVSNGSFKLSIPPEKARYLENRVGQRVTLGVRPEHLEDKTFANPDDYTQTLAANVEVVETLGAEVQLDVKVGDSNLVARVDPRTGAACDRPIELVVNMNKIHLFEEGCGKLRIRTEER